MKIAGGDFFRLEITVDLSFFSELRLIFECLFFLKNHWFSQFCYSYNFKNNKPVEGNQPKPGTTTFSQKYTQHLDRNGSLPPANNSSTKTDLQQALQPVHVRWSTGRTRLSRPVLGQPEQSEPAAKESLITGWPVRSIKLLLIYNHRCVEEADSSRTGESIKER